jgi:hypothetical protein
MRRYGILDLIERYEGYVYLKQSSKWSGIFLNDVEKAFSVRKEGPNYLSGCGRTEVVLSISEYVVVEAFVLWIFFYLFEVSEELLDRFLRTVHGRSQALAYFTQCQGTGAFF